MIPVLTVTTQAAAEITLRALSAEWDRHVRQADTTHDGTVWDLMIEAGVQAGQLGVDHTRYLTDAAIAVVDQRIESEK